MPCGDVLFLGDMIDGECQGVKKTYDDDPGFVSCQLCHFFVMLDGILDFVFLAFVPIVAVLMIVIGGAAFLFAGGNPQRLEQAKSIITSTLIGLVIIFAAWLIVNAFFIMIGVQDWTGLQGGWFTIKCLIIVP